MLLLSKNDVNKAVCLREIIDVVEKAQEVYGRGEGVNSSIHALFKNIDPKILPKLHGNFHSFSGYLGGEFNIEGLSSIASCVHNPAKFGLPYAVGMQIVNDIETGLPLSVMERSTLTEMVTPAVSAIGAKYLARKDSTTVAIIGCGMQGRNHLRAFKELFDIKLVKAFDIRKEILEKYVDEMSNETGIAIEPAESAADAIAACDIAEIAISPAKPIIRYDWIKPGALIIALSGHGKELYKEEIYNKIDKVVVDNQGNVEASQGTAKIEDPILLPKVIAEKTAVREGEEEKILFVHSGTAVNHVAAGYLVYKKAKEKKLGYNFELL